MTNQKGRCAHDVSAIFTTLKALLFSEYCMHLVKGFLALGDGSLVINKSSTGFNDAAEKLRTNEETCA